MTTISFTGYRPSKIGGYALPNPTYIKICQETEKLLLELKPDAAYNGAAQGFDQYSANVCIKLGIPIIFCIPFIGQELAWPEQGQRIYHKLLSKAAEVMVVSEGGYAAYKMQIRNQYLVDNCDILIACIQPTETNGGTYNCVKYAESIGRKIIRINPMEL